MSLSAKVSKEFEPAVRTRGHGYSVTGRVRVRQGSDRSVLANVRGSQNYTITLQFDDGVLEVSCTCPYYESYGPCKHIWATILTAEKTNYLSAAGHGGPVRLALQDEDADGAWDDDTDLEEEADLDEDTDFAAVRKSPATPRAPRKGAAPGAKPKRTPKSGWKKILARGRSTAETEPSLSGDAWTSKRQIIYLIDAQATMNGNLGLMVEVAYRELKKDGAWGKLKSRRIPVSQIPQLPEAEDRRILALLVGAKEDYDWSSRSYYYYCSLANF